MKIDKTQRKSQAQLRNGKFKELSRLMIREGDHSLIKLGLLYEDWEADITHISFQSHLFHSSKDYPSYKVMESCYMDRFN